MYYIISTRARGPMPPHTLSRFRPIFNYAQPCTHCSPSHPRPVAWRNPSRRCHIAPRSQPLSATPAGSAKGMFLLPPLAAVLPGKGGIDDNLQTEQGKQQATENKVKQSTKQPAANRVRNHHLSDNERAKTNERSTTNRNEPIPSNELPKIIGTMGRNKCHRTTSQHIHDRPICHKDRN